MLPRFTPLLPVVLLLAGCAIFPAPQTPVAGSSVSQQEGEQTVEAQVDDNVPAEKLPNQELTADLLMRFVVGDIAAQRGQNVLAAKSWLDIAQRTRDPRTARRAVELALSTGQPALALESVQIWAETTPESEMGKARQLQLSLLIRANRLAEVEALIPSLGTMPKQDLANFYMQLHQLWDRNADKAEIARVTGLLAMPMQEMPEAHFALAVMHASQGRDDLAQSELGVALKLRPWWEQATLYKVQLLAQRKQAGAAIAFLREAVSKNPEQLSFALQLARTLEESRQMTEARAAYDAILIRQPDQLDALMGSGLLAIQQRDLDTAYARFSSALMRGPRNANVLRHYLGQIEENRNHLDEALGWYRQTEGEDKRKAEMRIPPILAKQGKREAALQAVAALSAGTVAEKIENAQLEGQVWRELKDLPKARESLSAALALYPDSVELYYDRSILADQLNDVPAAEADLRKILEKQPENVMAINALGYILANRTDRLGEAEQLLNKAIGMDPDNATIIDSVGWLRFRQGRLKEAVEWLGRAYDLMADPEMAAHLAEALWQYGDKSKARTILEQAAQRDPANDLLQETRKRLGM